MKRYACSLSAVRPQGLSVQIKHIPMVAFASSDAEAIGKALLEAQRRWPDKEGWIYHSANAMEISAIIEGTDILPAIN